jgi:hypothetical protein
VELGGHRGAGGGGLAEGRRQRDVELPDDCDWKSGVEVDISGVEIGVPGVELCKSFGILVDGEGEGYPAKIAPCKNPASPRPSSRLWAKNLY